MPDIEALNSHQRAFLAQVKRRTEPAIYTVEGVDIKVNPDVFPPATDTRLLAAHIRTSLGERTLDLTSGSGIFSVIAGLQGATGLAVDINPAAVANSNQNFAAHGVNMSAVESNLFQNVPKEQFDQMFANGPFFEGDLNDPLDYACYGARAFIEGLFGGVRSRLKSSGKLLLVVSEFSDLDHLQQQAQQNKLKISLTDTRDSDDGQRKYRLYEIRS